MRVLVVGAGVIGVTSAWYLAARGHEVTVIEGNSGPGLATSYANAGQISAHLAEPWSNPSTLRSVPRWLFRSDSPLVFRPRLDWQQISWLMRFLRASTATRFRQSIIALANLGIYSRNELVRLSDELKLEYDRLDNGILLFHTDESQFAASQATAEKLREFGIEREVLSTSECIAHEPALKPLEPQLKGGILSRFDKSGDAYKFTSELAKKCASRGVEFHYDTRVVRFEKKNDGIHSVIATDASGAQRTYAADKYLVCAGNEAASLLRAIGIALHIYPVKGYSVTFQIRGDGSHFRTALTDAGHKIAFSRLGDRIRATGYAEISDAKVAVDKGRCQVIRKRALELFPEIIGDSEGVDWCGLRPMTPSNLPYIGRTRVSNLFVNAGHGTVGWTQACGSARAISEIMDGDQPACEFPFLM